ncbi:MAG: glutamate--tRNA ligase [Pseudomonadota bacterium]
MQTKTRFAPSPTGYLHIGGARTALFSWLYARKSGGQFVLRIEDTDRERSTDASVQAILDSMQWLGLECDEGPYFQTKRFDRYKQVIQQLLDADQAYLCYCSKDELDAMRAEQMANKQKPRYNGYWRDRNEAPPAGLEPVVRFKNPTNGNVEFDDQVFGKISVANSELDDLVIARSDGTPTYNFCVVVDDWDMGITHVIRGDDHINNTPRQINILKALGAELPTYAHLPMILGDDGKRMSKRHGAVSVMNYKDAGYLPEALLNYLARLGWSHGDQEVFGPNEMIELFSLDAVNRSGSRFDQEKLDWVNKQYLQADTARATAALAEQFEYANVDIESGPALADVIAVMSDRCNTLAEIVEQSRYFFGEFDEYDANAAKKQLRVVSREPLKALRAALEALDNWGRDALQTTIDATVVALDSKIGKVGPPLRVAVTGSAASPSLDVTLELVGKERTLARIDRALAYIDARESGAV